VRDAASVTNARPGPLADALRVVVLLAAGAAGVEIALILHADAPYAWLAALIPVIGLVYAGTGVAAWARRPGSRLGLLLVVAGGCWLLAGLANVDTPATLAVGSVAATLPLAVIVQLLLGFPTGRLHGRAQHVVVAAGYVVCLVLQAPLYLCAPGHPLSIADDPDVVDAAIEVQRLAGAAVVVAMSVLLAQRMRRADAGQRRVLLPLSAYGIVALLIIPVSSVVTDTFDATRSAVQLAVVGFLPVVFVLAASRGGFARTAGLDELGTWLGADEATRPGLRDALANALGDPSVRLLFRVPNEAGLVDDRGLPAADRDRERGAVDVELGGRVVGAIEYDAMLIDRPEEIREAGRVVALALDRQRLTVELRASRARIAAAADAERRRIARDLHDGLQSRLVLLAVQAGTDADRDALRANVQSAIDELRELVDGVMPAQLTERGLPAAVEDLRDRLPMPIELRVDGLEERLRPDVETAAYFVVSEAIANAVKHARPTTLAVTLERTDGRLRLDVADDGSGGVQPGGGLRGMADRVEALGGEIEVTSVAAQGTRVRAVIPCGS
jgi:signal transduction histidine kinase